MWFGITYLTQEDTGGEEQVIVSIWDQNRPLRVEGPARSVADIVCARRGMRYCVAHLYDAPGQPWPESDPAEEIHVIPWGMKVVTAVPIGALGRFLPILDEATAQVPPATCGGCGAQLPAPAPGDGA